MSQKPALERALLVSAIAFIIAGLPCFLAGLSGCAPARRPALDPTLARASVIELAYSVQAAAEQCTSNARHLQRFDARRSLALADACTRALIPARDAVVFVLPAIDPWTPASAAAVGCAGKSVHLAIMSVRAAFIDAGYGGFVSDVMLDGLVLGERVEPYALPSCDPLRPTSSSTTYVDPNIANVEPEYP